ncbi:hypothetical protein ACWEQU_24585 [Streptomyces nodosus]
MTTDLHVPGSFAEAALSYSYGDGATWTRARMRHTTAGLTATVDHGGRSGAAVTLKAELTDSRGNAVIQTIQRACLVR